jgi:hypothetical protein
VPSLAVVCPSSCSAKALEEESSHYLETIYPDDPVALEILEKQIARRKKKAARRS